VSDAEMVDATGEEREAALGRAVDALRGGGIVVLPTDTVYGIAADAFSPSATGRIFSAKLRPRRFPLPVLVRTPKQVPALVSHVPPEAERLMAAYWPGSLTIVLPEQDGLVWDIGDNEGTVALRMPLDPVCLDVIREVGPLAVTSANRSGQPPATDATTARDALGEEVSVYVDDGPRTDARPSTIVDLTRHEPLLIRDGDLPPDEVLAVARGALDPHERSPGEGPGGS
jgi:L-threonylcarbamoyladenylate synthase